MEITAIGGVLSAFGLSASAGLNAYIPLLVIALTARFTDLITLSAPFDLLTSAWVIGALVVLLVIEVLADKVPGIDHVNDLIGTFVRPAAGAVLNLVVAGEALRGPALARRGVEVPVGAAARGAGSSGTHMVRSWSPSP